MLVLGIETSCDETSAALLKGNKVLSNIIYSQIPIHRKFGGVVPELASRDHLKKISYVVSTAIEKANITIGDIEGVAVTNKPGLIGALLVGLSFAKSFAYYNSIPFIGIDHLEAHLFSIFLENEELYPFLGLTISGGHTSLAYVKNFSEKINLGETYDDAAGEAYDKVAKLLGLEYPGGPSIENLAKKGNPKAINFPRPILNSKNEKDRYNFSFSGLKSSVINYYRKNPEAQVADIAASFQAAVHEILICKLFNAASNYRCNNIVLAGGVACNKTLRDKVFEVFDKNKYNILIPSSKYCTDNAAMIAYLGTRYLVSGIEDNLNLGASARV